jgi:hypothetical protein
MFVLWALLVLQEQEWSLSSFIQAHEEQRCSLETFEINIDPILRHKLAKYVPPTAFRHRFRGWWSTSNHKHV